MSARHAYFNLLGAVRHTNAWFSEAVLSVVGEHALRVVQHLVGAVSDGNAQAVHEQMAGAVRDMQRGLQGEPHKEQLTLFGTLGRGGCGTRYYGALPSHQPLVPLREPPTAFFLVFR